MKTLLKQIVFSILLGGIISIVSYIFISIVALEFMSATDFYFINRLFIFIIFLMSFIPDIKEDIKNFIL